MNYIIGELAHMVERSLSMREVLGSIPRFSIFLQLNKKILIYLFSTAKKRRRKKTAVYFKLKTDQSFTKHKSKAVTLPGQEQILFHF